MNLYKRLEEATEAANRLRGKTVNVGLRSEKEMKSFAKDLATVIVFLDTTLPNFLAELTSIIDEAKK